jgi:hypothetical protein
MKLVPMADLVAVIPYPQPVSDFEHEIDANGSPRCRAAVSSACE